MDIIIFNCVTPAYFVEQTADLHDIFANTKDTNKCINDILDELVIIKLCEQLHIVGKINGHYNKNYQPNGLIYNERVNQVILTIT